MEDETWYSLARQHAPMGAGSGAGAAAASSSSAAAAASSSSAAPASFPPASVPLDLDPSLFVDRSSADQLTCAICLNVCHHPLSLPCSHLFCKSCLTGLPLSQRQCPECRVSFQLGSCIVNAFVVKQIENMQMRCAQHHKGCAVTIALGKDGRAMQKHNQECGFATVSCDKCNTMMMRKDAQAHRDTCGRPAAAAVGSASASASAHPPGGPQVQSNEQLAAMVAALINRVDQLEGDRSTLLKRVDKVSNAANGIRDPLKAILETDRADHLSQIASLHQRLLSSQGVKEDLSALKLELNQSRGQMVGLGQKVAQLSKELAHHAPAPLTTTTVIADGLVKWEVRGVSHAFRWEGDVDVHSDGWKQGEMLWHLELFKLANTMEVKLYLRLEDRKGRSGAKGSQVISLQRVPTAVVQKAGDNGFLTGQANAVRWTSFEDVDFAAGATMGPQTGTTLSAIQLLGCYNAQRDSILIVVQ